jgi:hypothetical protein
MATAATPKGTALVTIDDGSVEAYAKMTTKDENAVLREFIDWARVLAAKRKP